MVLFFFLVIGQISGHILAADYPPELSGNLEVGDRLYTDFEEDAEEEEIIDKYWYRRSWLRYRQKLSPTDYYYVKGQYYKKNYIEESSYDNTSLDFWANYTHQLDDSLRNQYLLTLRDKDYFNKTSKSYQLARLKYQLDYEYNDRHDYTIYLQRQWQDYINQSSNDNIYDRLSLSWDYEVNEDFELNTNLQFNREKYLNISESSNKYGQKLSVGFKWKLQ